MNAGARVTFADTMHSPRFNRVRATAAPAGGAGS
jgi:hypothetical protein